MSRCRISPMKGLVIGGGKGGPSFPSLIVTTRASRVKFVMGGVRSGKLVQFRGLNKFSSQVLLSLPVGVHSRGNAISKIVKAVSTRCIG